MNGIVARRTLFFPYHIVYVPRIMCAHCQLDNSQIVINTDNYSWSWAFSCHIHCGFDPSTEFIHSWESRVTELFNDVNTHFLGI